MEENVNQKKAAVIKSMQKNIDFEEKCFKKEKENHSTMLRGSAYQEGHRRKHIHQVGKIPCRRKKQPTSVFWLGKFLGPRRSLQGYKESDMTEYLSMHACSSIASKLYIIYIYIFRSIKSYSQILHYFKKCSWLLIDEAENNIGKDISELNNTVEKTFRKLSWFVLPSSLPAQSSPSLHVHSHHSCSGPFHLLISGKFLIPCLCFSMLLPLFEALLMPSFGFPRFLSRLFLLVSQLGEVPDRQDQTLTPLPFLHYKMNRWAGSDTT